MLRFSQNLHVRGAAILLPILLALLPGSVLAQTATLSGFVTDAFDGQPLEGATVALRDPSGAGAAPLFGAAANEDGLYLVRSIEPGTYALAISFVGYESVYDTLTFAEGEFRRDPGWRVDVDLDADYTLARASYQNEHAGALERFMEAPECAALGLLEMKASLTIGNLDWPPSESNPNVTAYASAATNVENGLGFVAGGYDLELSLSPSPEALRDTWFLDLTDGKRPQAIRCDPVAKES
jgi:hypothetical protein